MQIFVTFFNLFNKIRIFFNYQLIDFVDRSILYPKLWPLVPAQSVLDVNNLYSWKKVHSLLHLTLIGGTK